MPSNQQPTATQVWWRRAGHVYVEMSVWILIRCQAVCPALYPSLTLCLTNWKKPTFRTRTQHPLRQQKALSQLQTGADMAGRRSLFAQCTNKPALKRLAYPGTQNLMGILCTLLLVFRVFRRIVTVASICESSIRPMFLCVCVCVCMVAGIWDHSWWGEVDGKGGVGGQFVKYPQWKTVWASMPLPPWLYGRRFQKDGKCSTHHSQIKREIPRPSLKPKAKWFKLNKARHSTGNAQDKQPEPCSPFVRSIRERVGQWLLFWN